METIKKIALVFIAFFALGFLILSLIYLTIKLKRGPKKQETIKNHKLLIFFLIFRTTGLFGRQFEEFSKINEEDYLTKGFEELRIGNHEEASKLLSFLKMQFKDEFNKTTFEKPYNELIANDFFKQKKYKEALIYYKTYSNIYTQIPKNYYRIALCHYHLNEFKESQKAIQQGCKTIQNGKEEIHCCVSEILKLIDIKNEKDILFHYNEALRINPDFHSAYLGLSDFYHKTGSIDKSLEYSKKYLLQNFQIEFTKLKEIEYSNGIRLSDQDRYDELYSNLYTFILLNPDISSSLETYQDKNFSRDALYENNIYKESIKQFETRQEALLNLIIAYGLNNEFDKAILYCKELLIINPENAIGMVEIAHYCKLNEDYKEAESAFKKLSELFSEEQWIYNSLAHLYILTDQIFMIATVAPKVNRSFYYFSQIKPVYFYRETIFDGNNYYQKERNLDLIIDILKYPKGGVFQNRLEVILNRIKQNYNETGLTELECFLLLSIINELSENETILHDFFKDIKFKNKLKLFLEQFIKTIGSNTDLNTSFFANSQTQKNYSFPETLLPIFELALITELFDFIQDAYESFKDQIIKECNSHLISLVGVSYIRTNAFEKAIEVFNNYYSSGNQVDEEFYINFAVAYKNTNKNDLAVKQLQNGLKLNPKNENILMLLIELFEQKFITQNENKYDEKDIPDLALFLKYLNRIIRIGENFKDTMLTIKIKLYIKAGSIYKKYKEEKSVLKQVNLYKKALRIFDTLRNNSGELINEYDSVYRNPILFHLGESYFQLAIIDSKNSSVHLELSSENFSSIINSKGLIQSDLVSLSYFNLARINILQSECIEADSYIQKFLELSSKNYNSFLDAARLYKILWIFDRDKYFSKWADCIKEASKLNSDLTLELAIENIKKDSEIEELAISKKEELESMAAKTRQDLLSFLSHTFRNTLSTGPEIIRQTLSLAKKALERDYEDSLSYKAFNNLAVLFSTFTMVESLLDAFKMYSQNEKFIAEEWNKPFSGDKNVEFLFAQIFQQNIARFLFSENLVADRKRIIHSSETDFLKILRKNYLNSILSQDMDKLNAKYILYWCKENIPFIELEINDTDTTFNPRSIHYSLIYSILAETVFNALKYSSGEFPIKIGWEKRENTLFFECTNHFSKESTAKSDTRTGLQFIEYLIAKLANIRFYRKEHNDIFTAQLILELNGETV